MTRRTFEMPDVKPDQYVIKRGKEVLETRPTRAQAQRAAEVLENGMGLSPGTLTVRKQRKGEK